MLKRYFYGTITLLLVVLIVTVLIQRSCYKKSQSVATEIERVKSELKESPKLATIVISKKPKGIIVITKDIVTTKTDTDDTGDQSDTTIGTEEYDIPIESDFKAKIDTLGKVDLIYRKWGTCFVPAIDLDLLPPGYTFGVSARLVYAGPWGLDVGLGLYPILGMKAEISRRLPKFTNCKIKGGLFHDGKSLMGYAGIGVFLW